MSFQAVLNYAIPIITFFLMCVVGMDITMDDFRKARSARRAFIVGTLGQYALPFCAFLIVALLNPIPAVRDGMMLVASAPAGGISTYYTYLARCNVALSMTLTTVSTLAAAITMPLFLRFFHSISPQGETFFVPIGILFQKLILLLVIPVFTGCVIRHYSPSFVERNSKVLRRIGFFALACLILFIFYETWSLFVQSWLHIVHAAMIFVLFSMAIGYAFGLLFKLSPTNSFTLAIEFGTRNTAICTATAVIVLHRTEFATFAAIYFLLEAILIVPIIAIFRKLIPPS